MRATREERSAADRVCPLLEEPRSHLFLRCRLSGDDGREPLQALIAGVFQRSYGASIGEFYPDLLGFEIEGTLRGAAGLRPAEYGALFAEQYLGHGAHELISFRTGLPCRRSQLLEIGNLALPDAGMSRCVITALTAYLYGAGFHWAVFTAVPALRNAFRRMGLEPGVLAPADPARLDDAGRSWGTYYDHRPVVCFGSIGFAYRKLGRVIAQRQPRLRHLWSESLAAGRSYRDCIGGPVLASTGT